MMLQTRGQPFEPHPFKVKGASVGTFQVVAEDVLVSCCQSLKTGKININEVPVRTVALYFKSLQGRK